MIRKFSINELLDRGALVHNPEDRDQLDTAPWAVIIEPNDDLNDEDAGRYLMPIDYLRKTGKNKYHGVETTEPAFYLFQPIMG